MKQIIRLNPLQQYNLIYEPEILYLYVTLTNISRNIIFIEDYTQKHHSKLLSITVSFINSEIISITKKFPMEFSSRRKTSKLILKRLENFLNIHAKKYLQKLKSLFIKYSPPLQKT